MPHNTFIESWGWIAVALIWLIWTLVVFGVGWAIAYQFRSTERKHQAPTHEHALEVLKLRYARGELTREQFEQMKQDIVGG